MKLDTIVTQPSISAERFDLRPVRRSDAGLIAMYTADERVARATRSIPHPLPPGATEAFVARAMSETRREDVWVLDGSAHGLAEVLGAIGLKKMDREQSEIGYWVAPAFWNTGFASEAVQGAGRGQSAGRAHDLCRGVPGQSGLGPCADQLRLRISRRCRDLFGRARRAGADLDLSAQMRVTIGGKGGFAPLGPPRIFLNGRNGRAD